MIILSNIDKLAITFQFKNVSSKQFPQSIKISADSVRVSEPFLMSACMMVILNNRCIAQLLN
jgi:hypothetical protein